MRAESRTGAAPGSRAPRASIAALALALAALLGALGASAAAAGPDSARSGRAPDFVVRTADGKRFRLAAQRGKVVVFDFLVPGCGECDVESPSLQKAAQLFARRGVKVLILDVGKVSDTILRSYYYRQLGLRNVLVAEDRGYRVVHTYGVKTLGDTVIVGRDGKVAWRGSWVGNETKLLREIRGALR